MLEEILIKKKILQKPRPFLSLASVAAGR